MRHEWRGGCAALVLGLLGLLALATPIAAVAADVSACGDFRASGFTSFDIVNNISSSVSGATCLTFPKNSTIRLHGHVISGLGLEDSGSVGINIDGGDAFIWGPGIVKAFGFCIVTPDHMAIENLLLNQCAVGIIAGNSYKIREVRIHDCRASKGLNIGLLLGDGGFVESSIIRSCDTGVLTRKNNKIWNLVISNHNFTGLAVGGGTAVSRTVISSPRSISTIGLDYTGCCQAPTLFDLTGTGPPHEGCQDGSNSVQDHTVDLNIIGVTCGDGDNPVITDTATNCGGFRVFSDPLRKVITGRC